MGNTAEDSLQQQHFTLKYTQDILIWVANKQQKTTKKHVGVNGF